ncbi:MAG: YebC/PmpR family DNA-binding transcriptional regulator [Candidatus Portnoybacteria bacterium]|nr:YebC/PmpR family DNA-binding transcriptional regulator [Candidatus Portnoybacteria bacterium]
MSGHSKWHKVKHQKAVTDARKGKIFSKMAKIIAIAARKGGDPEMNPSLRMAIDRAKDVNMPKDKIDKAIKKGTGEDKEGQLEEAMYEAYGPEGSQLIIEIITDNKNRTLAELRHILGQYGGQLAENGSVKWNFAQKGIARINIGKMEDKEEIELEIIDSGADDFKWDNNNLEVYTSPENLTNLKSSLEKKGFAVEDSGLEWVAKNEISLDGGNKDKIEGLFDALDENEDVKDIYSNINL